MGIVQYITIVTIVQYSYYSSWYSWKWRYNHITIAGWWWFPTYEKIIQMFQTTNQLRLLRLLNNRYDILWWFDNYSAILWDIMIYRIYQQLNIIDIYICIYIIYICGYSYLTIWDVHIISKFTRGSLKTEVQPALGCQMMPEWSAWMEHRPVLLLQTCDTHSQYLNQTKVYWVYCTKYEGFNVTYFLKNKRQYIIFTVSTNASTSCDIFFGFKPPVDYDEFFGAPQYGHQPSLAMGTTLNQHGRRSKATVDQKYPLPIGSMVLVYMLALGVYWW